MADVANVGPSAQAIPVAHSEWPPDVLYIHLLAKIEDLKAHMGDLRTSDLLALQAAFLSAEKAVDTALVASEKQYAAALTAQEKAVSAALASAEKAVSAALAAQEKATDKYEREVKEWRAASNEWRDAMNDREAKFISQDAYDAAHGPVVRDVEDLKLSREHDRGRQQAQVAIIAFVFMAITVALRFLG